MRASFPIKRPSTDHIIEKAIERESSSFIWRSVSEWLVFSVIGIWGLVLEAFSLELKDYDFQMATIFLFENAMSTGMESNQELLARFKQVDFVKYAYPYHSNPSQILKE